MIKHLKKKEMEKLETLFEQTNKQSFYKYHDDDFNVFNKVHDWKNHVPQVIRNNWAELTERERKIVFVITAQLADNEDWD